MLTKARIKLNIKRLYSADGLAVKELLKVASLLHKATLKATTEEEVGLQTCLSGRAVSVLTYPLLLPLLPQDSHDGGDLSSALKTLNLKELKQYATEIIRSGAGLYDALAQEVDLRDARTRAVSGHVDSEFVEQSIQEAIHQVQHPQIPCPGSQARPCIWTDAHLSSPNSTVSTWSPQRVLIPRMALAG